MSELTTKNQTIALQLNEAVGSVLNQTNLIGFEKAYTTASSIETLQSLLTPQYMAPIMRLQGNRLGFKTDKDKTGGYPEDTVKNCLIEAVLMGLQPYGNQFNIIAGNTYVTKEGCGEILGKFPGLSYTLITGVPRPAVDNKTAVIDVEITWSLNGKEQTKTIPISVKMDNYTTVDALKGKATRKGRAWLIETLTGIEVADGDVQDIQHEVIKTTINPTDAAEEKRRTRISNWIDKATTVTQLNECRKGITANDSDLMTEFTKKGITLSASMDELKQFDPGDDLDLIVMFDDRKRELSKK